MISQRRAPARGEPVGSFLGCFAGETVNDSGIARMFLSEEFPKLFERAALGDDAVEQVRSVIAGGEHRGMTEPELGDDVASRRRVRGRGQRQQRNVRKAFLEDRQMLVFGAEVMAPLG